MSADAPRCEPPQAPVRRARFKGVSEAELDAMHMSSVAAKVTLPLVRALVAANPDQLLWASDWPHIERFTPNPHDADLVDLLPDWLVSDDLVRRVCVANPARLYGY